MSLNLNLLLLLLLVLSYHAKSGSVVKFFPGFKGLLPFELETGYIGIGNEEEVQTFYYFIKSENNPKEDPLLLWISGGPGCSSLSALFYENGPLAINMELVNGTFPSFISTTYSWTKVANIIFVDQPIGAGFSYKRTPYIGDSSDTIEIVRIHEFIQKWLGEYPEYSSNPFYIGGDSDSGKIIPAIVIKITEENYVCCKPPINLKGYILGNPTTDLELEFNHRISYAHGMALISDELYESLKRICSGSYYNIDPLDTKCFKLVEEYHKCIDKIFPGNILLPLCDGEITSACPSDGENQVIYWANDESVREALHIRKGTIREWLICRQFDNYNRDIINSIPYHKNVSGVRSLIYSGDHDMVVPYSSTEAWIKSLNYSIIDDWRPWMINDQVAGYTRTYANNMTYATIKGCGHTVEYKPKEGFILFQKWINSQL